jgi:hypothetical protein
MDESFTRVDTKAILKKCAKTTVKFIVPTAVFVRLEAYSYLIDNKYLNQTAKICMNAIAAPFTVQACRVDKVFRKLDILIYGESVPIIDDNRTPIITSFINETYRVKYSILYLTNNINIILPFSFFESKPLNNIKGLGLKFITL